jgi:putative spermidine/putrescine transport system substrate-binding protein
MKKKIIVGVVAALGFTFMTSTNITSANAASAVCSAANLQAAGGMDALVKAAKAEKQLNIITVPRDWANYGEAIDAFTKAFGIKINDDNPDGSSAYELQTIKTAPASKQPDVVDIGITHTGAEAQDSLGRSLFTPYKVVNWKDISSDWKDPNGLWYGDYSGSISIAYDSSVTPAPTKISDLTNAAYKGMVALGGDPTAATEAFTSVFAAAIANGGSLTNVQPGIDFFAGLKKSGNFVSVPATGANYASGAYKIALSWSYNGPGAIASAAKIGKTLKYVTPADVALIAPPYVQAINAKAPHCAAARLWEEFLYSQNKGLTSKTITAADIKLPGSTLFSKLQGGQNIWALGAAHPIMEAAMKMKKTLVNPPAGFEIPKGQKTYSPNFDQVNAARDVVNKNWASATA